MVSKLEEEIAFILECPILMGDFDQVDLIFNKSGAKSAFEINELAFPISAWDIKTEEEFYSSLAHLIAMYPTINVWLFKINKETNGRGIAYLELSKIDKLTQLKQEKNTNPDFTINLLVSLTSKAYSSTCTEVNKSSFTARSLSTIASS